MKKILILAAALLLNITLLYAGPESNLQKRFNDAFPNAQNTKWHKDANGYLVSFTQGGTINKIIYDKKGNFVNSLRYYGEKDLPTNLLLAVKNKYQGKDIYGVVELTTNYDVEYHITLYDGKNWYRLKAYNASTIKEEDVLNNETESGE